VLLFCTTPFLAMAKAITEGMGSPGMRILEMDHPLGGLTPPEVDDRARQVIDHVLRLLEGETE
jgi:hypothetical protein